MILFCQMDVTGRTESDPAAETLARNALQYLSGWKPSPARTAVYVGDPAGRSHLEAAGVAVSSYLAGNLSPEQVLVVGPLGGQGLAGDAAAISAWLKAGGQLLAIGLDEREANAFLPFPVSLKKAEHIAAFFEPFARHSLLAGISPAEVHNRDPRELPLVTAGATIFGNGVLAWAEPSNVVFCQLAPWQFDWRRSSNLKRTYRRTSVLVQRLLANMGVASATPILGRFHRPVSDPDRERRWQEGLYLDRPEEWDDPYRFFRW